MLCPPWFPTMKGFDSYIAMSGTRAADKQCDGDESNLFHVSV
jgi:hypothetical protein